MKLFFLVILSTFQIHAKVETEVRFAPVANFAYQLECVSGAANHCSRKNYEKLWETDFLKTPEDKEMIQRWSSLMKRYGKSVSVHPDEKISNSPRYIGINLATKIRIASLQASGLNDYLERLDLVFQTQDRVEAEKIIRHFYPRFEKWWYKVASQRGANFKQRIEALLLKKKNKELLDKFARFYEAELPDKYPLSLNLYYRPDLVNENTAGQQLQNYSVVEFLEDESPSDRIDVIMHELCHFLYISGPEDKFDRLQTELSKTRDGVSSYNLLNEALATTFGNGMVARANYKQDNWEKYAAREMSFYSDFQIDKAAKTILPWLDGWLAAGKTIYDSQFAREYLGRLQLAFGPELTNPRSLLKSMVLVSDSRFDDRFNSYVRKSMNCSSQWYSIGDWATPEKMFSSYNEQKTVNGLLIVHPDNLKKLKTLKLASSGQLKAMQAAYKKEKRLLYSIKDDSDRITYIVVAENAKSVYPLLDELAQARSHFEGLYTRPQAAATESSPVLRK